MNWVTIKKSNREPELLVLKSRLESLEIPCFLKNQYTTQVMNYFPSFEVELQVPEEFLTAALSLLKEFEAKHL